jgi:transposase
MTTPRTRKPSWMRFQRAQLDPPEGPRRAHPQRPLPPEQLLLASLLQAFYGIRSERLLLDQLHYNLLFRWFVGLSPDDPIWHPTTFTKNREHLLNSGEIELSAGLKAPMSRIQ